MRVTGSLALAALVSGVSAFHSFEPPQLWQAGRPSRHAPPKAGPKTQKEPVPITRAKIWREQDFEETHLPATAYKYPYNKKPAYVVAAEEEAAAECTNCKKKDQVERLKQLQAKMEEHKATVQKLKGKVKGVARQKQLSDVLKAPVDAPVEWTAEETPESAEAPWPPHEEAPAEAPAAERAEARAADAEPSSLAQSRPAQEKRRAEVRAKRSGFYLKKCSKIFAGLDFDGDSSIEEEEVYAFFDAAWRAYDPEELTRKFLAEADGDRDGQVSAAEWQAFAEEAQKGSSGKAERWNPLEHLKRGVSNIKQEINSDTLGRYSKKLHTGLFHVMDENKDDVATKAELQAFLVKKYNMKDPAEFSERLLAEADTDKDTNVGIEEFLNFSAEVLKTSTSQQEKWNPLLHIITAVRPSKAA